MRPLTIGRFTGESSAVKDQLRLAGLVTEESPRDFRPRLVCGLDAAYRNGVGFGVAAVWDCSRFRIVEICSAEEKVCMEYVPGFFSYREGPVVLSAAKRLNLSPDAYIIDGHGRAHPRRFGLACHVGLALAKPTIGVAKRVLYGQKAGNYLIDDDGSRLAVVLRERGGRPYYISVGHLIYLEDAVRLVRRCVVRGQIAPLNAAHIESLRQREKAAA